MAAKLDLAVKEVAATLRVCTATVYAMVERGEGDRGRPVRVPWTSSSS